MAKTKLTKTGSRVILLFSILVIILAVTGTILYSSNILDRVFARDGQGPVSQEEDNDAENESTDENRPNDGAEPGELPPPLASPGELAGRREILVRNVEVNERFTDGAQADIRIRYANGEEYTILKNITFYLLNTETDGIRVFADLNEKELLFLSSALTDREIYSDTLIYPAVIRGERGEPGTGNYRPVREVLLLMEEEGFIDGREAEVYRGTRDKLEERLLNSSVYYKQAVKDALRDNGFEFDSGNGYWMIN